MRKQQIRLLILWFFFTFVTFAFLFLFSMMRDAGASGGTAKLVQWLGVVTAGTLVGMVATMIMQERKPELKNIPAASSFIFGLTVFLCVLYWMIAMATILFWGAGGRSDVITLADWLFAQLPWITFLQAALLALLAFFFNKMRLSAQTEDDASVPTEEV
jgi:hypothetical protein